MMKHVIRKLLLWFAVLWILAGGTALANEMPQAFLDGIKYYKAGNFEASVSAFRQIADNGVRNGKLFYNIGNAYLKKGEPGYAILWYERALRLMPDDPDLRFNHAYALSFTKDTGGDGVLPLVRILFFWRYLLSFEMVRWIAVGLNLVFWLIVAVRLLLRKKVLKAPGIIVLGLTILFSLTACYNYYERINVRKGIVLPAQISVRSGLSNGATELFVLHAGTKVKVDKQKGDFFRIRFSDDKIGWVRRSEVGII